MSDDSTILDLNDKNLVDQSQTIELKTSSTTNVQIELFQLFKFSTILQEGHLYQEIIGLIKSKMASVVDSKSISDESIQIFFQLIQEKRVQISSRHFWDLYKLSEIFQVKPIQICLDQYAKEHSNNIDFIINLLIEREKREERTEQLNQKLTKEYSNNAEDLLREHISECLQNEFFGQLSISTIYRILDGRKEEIDHDLLFEFINQRIEERHLLFSLLKLSKLSDSNMKILYHNYKENGNKFIYYKFISNDLDYIFSLITSKEKLEQRVNEVEQDKIKYKNQIDELTSKNKTLIEQQDAINGNNEKYKNQIVELNLNIKTKKQLIKTLKKENEANRLKLKDLETRTKEEVEQKVENIAQLLSEHKEMIEECLRNKIFFSFIHKPILHYACEIQNFELVKFLILIKNYDINSKYINN